MSTFQGLPSYPLPPDPPINIKITYIFAWEKCTDEDPHAPSPSNRIHITGPIPGATTTRTTALDDTQTDSLQSLLNPPESSSSSPKTTTITSALSNNQIPCTATFVWRTYLETFYCQYDPFSHRFSRFVLDTTADDANEDALGAYWGKNDIQIGHTPAGFHSNRLQGDAVFDERGRKMLFVKMDAGSGWSVKLWGKIVGEGEEAGLEEEERRSLGLEV